MTGDERDELAAERAAALEATGWDAAVRRLLDLTGQALDAEIIHYHQAPVPSGPAEAVDVDVRAEAGGVRGVLRFVPRSGRAPGAPIEGMYRLIAQLVSEQLASWDRANAPWLERAERISALIDQRLLPMAFQPIVGLLDERVVGVEALARFPGHPTRTPDRWFSEAAAVGLGVELEVLAVASALRAFEVLPTDCYLSVNVSPRAAASPLLAELLASAPLHRVVLEITEHQRIGDYEGLNRCLGPLREAGVRIAVDDAGSGFASFRHVLKMQPDIIKLDTSLVHEIDSDSLLRALSYSLTAFASALDAEVIAEGVEAEREADALRFLGVRYAQGYHFGRPGPLEAILERDALVGSGSLSRSRLA